MPGTTTTTSSTSRSGFDAKWDAARPTLADFVAAKGTHLVLTRSPWAPDFDGIKDVACADHDHAADPTAIGDARYGTPEQQQQNREAKALFLNRLVAMGVAESACSPNSKYWRVNAKPLSTDKIEEAVEPLNPSIRGIVEHNKESIWLFQGEECHLPSLLTDYARQHPQRVTRADLDCPLLIAMLRVEAESRPDFYSALLKAGDLLTTGKEAIRRFAAHREGTAQKLFLLRDLVPIADVRRGIAAWLVNFWPPRNV